VLLDVSGDTLAGNEDSAGYKFLHAPSSAFVVIYKVKRTFGQLENCDVGHAAFSEASQIAKLAEGLRGVGGDTRDHLVQGHAERQEF